MKFSILWLAPGAVATWNTFYALSEGKSYLHLSNNDLLGVSFSISGTNLNIENNQQIAPLATPPQNSSLFLYNETLFAFNADLTVQSEKNICGQGVISLSRYDSSINNWTYIPLNFSQIEDTSFYQGSSYLTPAISSTENMYIYGGSCSSSNFVSNRLISFNPYTGVFANITTTTKPQPFHGASNLLAPNPQTQLIIGGQSTDNGWLNMYQLATWAFSSGWSFEQVSTPTNTSVTNSRKNSLALPIFQPLQNSSVATILDQYVTSSVLLLGGVVASDKKLLFVSKLTTSSNSWFWNDIPTNLTNENVMGATTIFNTLIVVNGTAGLVGGKYTVNLYDTTTFKLVSNLMANTQSSSTQSSSSDNSSNSTTTTAIVGTIIPVSAIIAAVAVTYYFMKRKRKNNENDDNEEFDYQIGNYYDQSTLGSKKPPQNPFLNVTNNPYGNHHHLADTASTLDVQSMDLWVKKREQFEQEKSRKNFSLRDQNPNPSFLASSETLSTTESKISDMFEIHQGGTHYSSTETHQNVTIPSTPVPNTPAGRSIFSSPLIDRSVSKLKKSLSFHTPQPYGLLKKKSYNGLRKTTSRSQTLFDDEFAYESDGEFEESKPRVQQENEVGSSHYGDNSDNSSSNHLTKEVYDDEDDEEEADEREERDLGSEDEKSFDDNVDVQVLVSSKRRSVLRVINPDLETVAEEESLRQRIPSGPIDPDL